MNNRASRITVPLLAFLLLAVSSLGFASWMDPEPEPVLSSIQVNVLVLGPAGEPIQSAPVSAFSPVNAEFGLTDESGTMTLSVERVVGLPIHVVLDPGLETTAPIDTIRIGRERFIELRDQFAWPWYSSITNLEPNQQSVSVTIQAFPSTALSGSVTDQHGAPAVGFSVLCVGTLSSIDSNDEGNFTLSHVPVGKNLLLLVGNDQITVLSEVSAADVVQGNPISPIILPQIQLSSSSLKVQMTERETLYSDLGEPLMASVTLIQQHGDFMVTFQIPPDADDFAFSDTPLSGLDVRNLKVPAGAYFVVPGAAVSSPSIKVWQLIHGGHAAALINAEVPLVTIVDGDDVTITIEGPATLNAVMSANSQP